MADWLSTEYLVTLIEKSIDPDSIVEHNVELPDLRSATGLTRQCDIIITTGSSQRQTITLVEVQRRNRKVELQDFQGWQQKMIDIGAQHLICVSTIGFPESIKDKAKLSGNTIRLITLKKQETETLPIKIPKFHFSCAYPEFNYVIRPKIQAFVTKGYKDLGKVLFRNNEKVFRINNEPDLKSCDDLVIGYLKNNKKGEGQVEVSLPIENQKLQIINNGTSVPINFKCMVNVKYVTKGGNADIYSYEQMGDGVLAWIFEGASDIGGKKIGIKIPAVQKEGGIFQISRAMIEIDPSLL